MLKATHRIESLAGHFARTVGQDSNGMGRWEISDPNGKIIADSSSEELALLEAKRQIYKLEIQRLEQESNTDKRIATLIERLNEELKEVTKQAIALRS